MGGKGNAAALAAPSPQLMLFRCSLMPREFISQEKKIKCEVEGDPLQKNDITTF
jgi:hypothetical protein